MATVHVRSLCVDKIGQNSGGRSTRILRDVTLDVRDGELLVLIGPSGCGKSTLLRCIAGLESASAGEISINDRVVNDVDPRDRDIAMVFQSYALYPHMSVRDNLSFALRLRRMPEADITRRVDEAANLLAITQLLDRLPRELSGGQRQRVAMGRAIVRRPQVFLFDEPLSNLDAALRQQMRVELLRLHRQLGTTTIYVTHDQAEAFAVADRVVIMNAGRIEQMGTPIEVYARPASEFVARFLGLPNLIQGTVISCAANVAVIRTALGHLHIATDRALKTTQTITLLIRPDAATLDPNPFDAESEWFAETPQANVLDAELIDVAFRGRYQRVVVRVNDVDLVFEIETRSSPGTIGRRVRVALLPSALLVL